MKIILKLCFITFSEEEHEEDSLCANVLFSYRCGYRKVIICDMIAICTQRDDRPLGRDVNKVTLYTQTLSGKLSFF